MPIHVFMHSCIIARTLCSSVPNCVYIYTGFFNAVREADCNGYPAMTTSSQTLGPRERNQNVRFLVLLLYTVTLQSLAQIQQPTYPLNTASCPQYPSRSCNAQPDPHLSLPSAVRAVEIRDEAKWLPPSALVVSKCVISSGKPAIPGREIEELGPVLDNNGDVLVGLCSVRLAWLRFTGYPRAWGVSIKNNGL